VRIQLPQLFGLVSHALFNQLSGLHKFPIKAPSKVSGFIGPPHDPSLLPISQMF